MIAGAIRQLGLRQAFLSPNSLKGKPERLLGRVIPSSPRSSFRSSAGGSWFQADSFLPSQYIVHGSHAPVQGPKKKTSIPLGSFAPDPASCLGAAGIH